MNDPFVLNHIKNIPLFERLTPEQLAALSLQFQVLRFQPGEIVFAQGQPTQGMFVFISGKALLSRQIAPGQNGGQPVEQKLGLVTGGQYLNEAALSAPMIESATLRVVEPSVILFLSRGRLEYVLQAHPNLQGNLRGHLDEEEQQVTRMLFTGQRPTEIVVRAWRRHPWVWIRYTPIPILVGIALVITAFSFAPASGGLALAIGALGIIIAVGVSFYLYAEWKDDALILTSERIIKIHNNFIRFTKSLNEIPLERVLAIKIDIPPADAMARLLNYGTILIKTAGETGNVELNMLPNPKAVQTIIFAEHDRFKQVVEQRSRGAIRADVERALGLGDGSAPPPTPTARNVVQVSSQGFPFAKTRFINENGEVVYRKHLTVWFSHIALPSVAVLLGLIGMIAALAGVSFFGGSIPTLIALPLAFFVLLFGVVWFYMSDWDWRNDTVTINPQTITIIHKRPLWLENEIDRVTLSQVDNVISRVDGFVNNLLNRGDVRVFLIGTEKPKIIAPIYAPQEFHAEVSRRQAELKNRQEQERAKQQRESIAEYLRAYHETIDLRQAGNTTQQPAPNNYPPAAAYPPAQQPSYAAQSPNYPPAQQPPTQAPAQSPAPFFDPRAANPQPPAQQPPPRDARPPNIPRTRP